MLSSFLLRSYLRFSMEFCLASSALLPQNSFLANHHMSFPLWYIGNSPFQAIANHPTYMDVLLFQLASCLSMFPIWTPLQSPLHTTVRCKTIAMFNPNTAHFACCNHPWRFCLALVRPNKVQTLCYKLVPGSCDLAQRWWRYGHLNTAIPLQ